MTWPVVASFSDGVAVVVVVVSEKMKSVIDKFEEFRGKGYGGLRLW